MPAAAPDPKSTVICYAYFLVTGKDNIDNGGVGRDRRLFLRVTTGSNPAFLLQISAAMLDLLISV